MKEYLVIVFLLLNSIVYSQSDTLWFAQPNFSFEISEIEGCNTTFSPFNDDFISMWEAGTGATPDYFIECDSTVKIFNVPENSSGFQNPKDGRAYAGIINYDVRIDSSEWNECLALYYNNVLREVKLGDTICFSYWMSFAEESNRFNKTWGAVLTDKKKLGYGGYTEADGQLFLFPEDSIKLDFEIWQRIYGELIIDDEKYLEEFFIILGSPLSSFGKKVYDLVGNLIEKDTLVLDSNGQLLVDAPKCFSYIDATCIKKKEYCDCFPIQKYTESSIDKIFLPNIITPNSDGFNDFLEFSITIPSIIIYNRWGTKIYSQENYSNTWPNQTISPGVYFYVISDGINTKSKSLTIIY